MLQCSLASYRSYSILRLVDVILEHWNILKLLLILAGHCVCGMGTALYCLLTFYMEPT